MSLPAYPDPTVTGSAQYNGGPFTSLGTVAGTVATATGVVADMHGAPMSKFGLTVGTAGGTATSFSVVLYGSASGSNYTPMGTVSAVGTTWYVDKPCAFVRADLTALSGLAAGAAVTAVVVGTR